MKYTTFFLFQLLWVYYGTAKSDENCLKIRDCQSLQVLLQNRDKLPNMTRIDVYRYIRDLNCGFDGIEAMVECPAVEGRTQLICAFKHC